jgi:signal transduction histidine kinase/DNA-binding response OmpR family regulator/HPt (histidine-containing phosphotransfer) domain-containing protein
MSEPRATPFFGGKHTRLTAAALLLALLAVAVAAVMAVDPDVQAWMRDIAHVGWMTTLAGLAITLALALAIRTTVARSEDLERLVARRTEELIQRHMADLEAARDVQQKHAAELARLVDELEREQARTEQASSARGEFLESLVAERTRELQREKAKAEAANAAKGQFLANMSHEMRTPLHGVIGMTEIALDMEADDALHGILSTINREADALLAIINDVLDYSKIEAERMNIESIPFDLRTTIDDVASGFALRAFQKGLDINASLDPSVQSLLLGDPGRLRQVLVNLVGNAIKFTSAGEVSFRGDLLEDRGAEVLIRFSITDTGIGIPKDKQDSIFESFTQADGSTTRIYGGTGLGTTISRTLVALMGGDLKLESEEGQGTTFWFDLVFKKQLVHDDSLPRRHVVFRDLQVLVVDDNQNSRFIVRKYLTSWKCQVVEAGGAAEALVTLDKWRQRGEAFGLILTDYLMPEMNGFELVKQIRAREAGRLTPCIILTSGGNRGDGKSCRDIGIQGYLTKPVRRDDLYHCIEAVMSGPQGDGANETGRLVTRHTIREAHKNYITILLTEDYPTNQQIAMRHLRSAGYTVDLAENGLQAVQAFTERAYDLILMDIQMPGMDGYEASREIRRIEAERHRGKRVPIVAMTAHAVKEYIEKCLESGMDDYVSKPVKKKDLLAKVDQWAPRSVMAADGPAAPPIVEEGSDSADLPPMDYGDVLHEFGDDKGILQDVMDGFVANVDSQLALIRQAIADGDAALIRREAHSIKGGAANLNARTLSEVASVMEKLGREGDLEGLRETFPDMEEAFGRLRDFIASVRDDSRSGGTGA